MTIRAVSSTKLTQAIDDLEHALSFADNIANDRIYFLGISKAYESCLEYAWNYFKRVAGDQGLDVYSPKEAIKTAGRIGLIDDVEKWLDFIDDRNLAVHDYMAVDDDAYLKTIRTFFKEVAKLRAETQSQQNDPGDARPKRATRSKKRNVRTGRLP